MGLKKKIGKILDDTAPLVDEDLKAKQLRKKSAFAGFLGRLDRQWLEVDRQLQSKKLSDKERKSLEKQRGQLEKGLKKGRKILTDM